VVPPRGRLARVAPFPHDARMGGPDPIAAQGWCAELALGFARRGERTVLASRRHDGPLVVQKPLHPEGPEVCHAIVVHPPAGIAGGDRLSLLADVAEGGHALLTTPGAAKWYRSSGSAAEQGIAVDVHDGAALEWLPQESIVYDGAVASLATQVRLRGSAAFLGWELVCLGRTASGERFEHGSLALATTIERDGRPIWIERGVLTAGARLAASPAGLDSHPVFGTFVATLSADRSTLDRLRQLAPRSGEGAVTAMPEVAVVRYLGGSTEAARAYFRAAWEVLRPPTVGRAAAAPRIWST
jgi:urease accessory protein